MTAPLRERIPLSSSSRSPRQIPRTSAGSPARRPGSAPLRGRGARPRPGVLPHAVRPARAGDGHDPGLFAEHPGQADLRGRRALFRGQAAQQVQQRLVLLHSPVRKLRHGGAVVGLGVENLALSVAAGQKAVRHGREGHQPHAQLLQRREEGFIRPGHHGVPVLHRRHRADRVRAAQVCRIRLRNAPVRDLSLADEVRHRPGDLLGRHGRVDAVLKIQVDALCAQAPQRPLHRLADGRRPGIGEQRQRHLSAGKVEPEAELRGDGHPSAEERQGLAHERLVCVRVLRRAVDLRRVKEGIAHLHRLEDAAHSLPLFHGRAVCVGQSHAPQPHRGYGQPAAQGPRLHLPHLLFLDCTPIPPGREVSIGYGV